MKKEISEFDIFEFLSITRINYKRHIVYSGVGAMILFLYSLSITPMFKVSMDVIPSAKQDFSQNISSALLGGPISEKPKQMIIFESVIGSNEMSNAILNNPEILKELEDVIKLDHSGSFLGKIKNALLYQGQVYQSPQRKLNSFISGFINVGLKEHGVYQISTNSSNPKRDKEILRTLILKADQIAREKEIIKSRNKVEYLRKKIQSTSVNEYQLSLINILAEEEKGLLVAEVNTPYSFDVIQELSFSPKPYSPNVVFLVFVGIFFGISISIIRDYISS